MANDPETAPIGEDKRVDSLEDRIVAARKAEDDRQAKEHPAASSGSASLTVISTMVGYPLGGIIIGFGLDNLFDTLPWLTIILMFLAFAGGCIHAMRLAKERAN